MTDTAQILSVYQTGELTVVGFGGQEVLDQIDVGACREEILRLVEAHQCRTLAFDLKGVRLIPSGMLGLLASLRHHRVAVQIYNPSPDVREVLEVTKLNEILTVQDIDG